MAIRSTRIQSYLYARAAGSSHDGAVKLSNAAVAKVRKALGFTIGPDPINF
jgi:hypothetical protein